MAAGCAPWLSAASPERPFGLAVRLLSQGPSTRARRTSMRELPTSRGEVCGMAAPTLRQSCALAADFASAPGPPAPRDEMLLETSARPHPRTYCSFRILVAWSLDRGLPCCRHEGATSGAEQVRICLMTAVALERTRRHRARRRAPSSNRHEALDFGSESADHEEARPAESSLMRPWHVWLEARSSLSRPT